jgi:hypothetical protein
VNPHALGDLGELDEGYLKAIVRDTYGSPDVLELRDIDKPEIEDDEVLIRVHAAGVDRGVWHIMTGLPISYTPRGLRPPRAQEPRHRLRRGRGRGGARQECEQVPAWG